MRIMKYSIILCVFIGLSSMTSLLGEEKKPIMKTVTELSVDEKLYSTLSSLMTKVRQDFKGYYDKFIWEVSIFKRNNHSLILISLSEFTLKDLEYKGYFFVDKQLFFCLNIDNSCELLKPTKKRTEFTFERYMRVPYVGGYPSWLYEYVNGEIVFLKVIDTE